MPFPRTSIVNSRSTIVQEEGFSLIEIIISVFLIAILSVILIGTTRSLFARTRQDQQAIASKAATKEIEHLRNLSFLSIASGTSACDAELADKLISNCLITKTVTYYDPPTNQVKQVKVTISWTYQGQNKSVTMQTLITSGGL